MVILTLIFGLRIIGQPLSLVFDFLPSFASWHSSIIPYSSLLILQIFIFLTMLYVSAQVRCCGIKPNYTVGIVVFWFAFAYAGVMLVRLLLPVFIETSNSWFNKPLPTFFHLILASWFFLFSYYHRKLSDTKRFCLLDLKDFVRWGAYPAVVAFGYFMYFKLLPTLGPTFSAYLVSVIFGLFLITTLELLIPYRTEWLPRKEDIKVDLAYMVTVQVLLPYFLTISCVNLLEYFNRNYGLNFNIWPSDVPVLLQTVLMILVADFFRYWLHRTAHTWRPLWKFHAVHHSVEKLYWLNVGRFHPVEKVFQFSLESLPFIILGAGQEALSAYFVFYAINGFFQHSNIDVKMGWLNYIISSAELHRWHHSREIQESNSNYGNNVILWDIVFNSFYFPKNNEVEELGLQYKKFPKDFVGQLKAPFNPSCYQR